mmetsp:Transcript_117618/g.379633  ORF Transcript_117618/g.379633 Transcript_117618/m.379633 type:complete len:177 (+) Transcript_117618:186-716(+)
MQSESKMLAIGYDPVQRAEQWKRRVGKEEQVISSTLCSAAPPSSADTRLELLQQTLQGVGALPASSRGRTAASGHSSLARSMVGSSAAGRSTAGTAGRAIAQTPRSAARSTPLQSVRGLAPSRAGSIGSRVSDAAAAALKAELEAETQRRMSAEQELQKLQSLLGANASGADVGSF